MHDTQQQFIHLAIHHDALKFGQFTLKSGRFSPYFFNLGHFCAGEALSTVGQLYAQTLASANLEFDMIFGPAYKGIPLACSTVIAFATHHQRNIPYAFNRKEPKAHGEGGMIVGAPLRGKVLIIDDVITAGTAIRQALQIIQQAGATPAGIVVALDRQERGLSPLSAIQEIQAQYHVPVISIIQFSDIVSYVKQSPDFLQHLPEIEKYQKEFGI